MCWEGRDEVAAFPAVPLLEGRFKIRICGGGAAGRESSWITMAVRTGEPPALDFFDLKRISRGNYDTCVNANNGTKTFLCTYFAS